MKCLAQVNVQPKAKEVVKKPGSAWSKQTRVLDTEYADFDNFTKW